MAKKTEDEIQQKLVELEVAMKSEQAIKAAAEKMKIVEESQQPAANTLMTMDAKQAASIQKKEESDLTAELYQFGGYASLAVGLLMVMSHIHVGMMGFWGMGMGAGGLMLIPLFVGIGMLIYNYRSRIAQLVTVASLGLVIFTVISRMTLSFYGLSLLDLIILALPICGGLALLAKANDKRRQARETKLLK